MATNRYEIEAFLDSKNVPSFFRETAEGSHWLLPLTTLVMLCLTNNDYLLFRSVQLAKLTAFNEQQQQNLFRNLLLRNSRLPVGHYCITSEDVIFEATLPIDNAEITAEVFHHCLLAVVAEMTAFASSINAMCSESAADIDLDQLLRKLFDGSNEDAGHQNSVTVDSESTDADIRSLRV